MSDSTFDSLMASSDPPPLVLTTVAEDERAGCLVGFHAQAGISPQRYCLWLSKVNHTYRVSLRTTHFAAHFLTLDDFALAKRFGTLSGEDVNKFAGLDLDLDPNGVPLLLSCPHRMTLERLASDGPDRRHEAR